MERGVARAGGDVNARLIKELKMSADFDPMRDTSWKGLKGGKRVITGPPSKSPIRSPTRIESDVQVRAGTRWRVSVVKWNELRLSLHVSTSMSHSQLSDSYARSPRWPSRTGCASASIHRACRAPHCDRKNGCCLCEQEYIAARSPHDWQHPAGENTFRSLGLNGNLSEASKTLGKDANVGMSDTRSVGMCRCGIW